MDVKKWIKENSLTIVFSFCLLAVMATNIYFLINALQYNPVYVIDINDQFMVMLVTMGMFAIIFVLPGIIWYSVGVPFAIAAILNLLWICIAGAYFLDRSVVF